MLKYLLISVPVIIIIALGAYLTLNKINAPIEAPIAPVVQQISKVTPTPTPTPLAATDTDINNDLTALDQDLAGLDNTEASFTNDLKGL